jgi:transposase-like protein
MPEMSDAELAKKLGVARSTIRARRSRGTPLTRAKQTRLKPERKQQIARAVGTVAAVAKQFKVSPTTVKRLRKQLGKAKPKSKKRG